MKSKKVKNLSSVLSGRTNEEMNSILVDLLTPAEIDDLYQRFQIIKFISEGVTHRKIAKTLGVSISKVTRGSKSFLHSKGGFKMLISR